MRIRPLKGYGTFDAILKSGTRVTVGPIGLTVLVTSKTQPIGSLPGTGVQQPNLLLGVAVGKRTARMSVVRSRIRRLLRVATRAVLIHHQTEMIEAGVTTMIVMWRKPISHPSEIGLADVHSAVTTAFNALCSKLAGNGNPFAGDHQ